MKLNCDLGELIGEKNNDALIMPYIDQANIACGFHGSDPLTISSTVKLAVAHNVTIGAHPSYPDKEHFGRKSIKMTSNELIASIHYQLGALQGICQAHQTTIKYIKPHGALYNDMMANPEIFEHVCKALALFDHSLPLMIQALPNTAPFEEIAKKHQINLYYEAFADRAYQTSGLLVPRSQSGAMITDKQQVLTNISQFKSTSQMTCIDGSTIELKVDSLCVHGDNQAAINLTSALRTLLNGSD